MEHGALVVLAVADGGGLPEPQDIISWAQVLIGAPVAVTVLAFCFTAWRLLDKGKIVLGREKIATDEENNRLRTENNALRGQLDIYRDKVESEIVPALIRATDTVSRVISREERQ